MGGFLAFLDPLLGRAALVVEVDDGGSAIDGCTSCSGGERWSVNHKRIYRLYGEEHLAVRTRRRKKRASHLRVVLPRPTRPNEQWCMDSMADRLEDGRRIRILTVEDVFTRECLAVEIDVSLTSARVVSVLASAPSTPPRRARPSQPGSRRRRAG
jgi:transposase InsO family protein